MLQALLQGVCLQTLETPFSATGILQPFLGTREGSLASPDHFHKESLTGDLYQHQLH